MAPTTAVRVTRKRRKPQAVEPELAFRGGLRLRLRSRFVAEVRHSFFCYRTGSKLPVAPARERLPRFDWPPTFSRRSNLRPADLGTINGGGHGRPSEETSNGRCCRACRWNRLVPAYSPVSVQSGCKPASLEDRPGASRRHCLETESSRQGSRQAIPSASVRRSTWT